MGMARRLAVTLGVAVLLAESGAAGAEQAWVRGAPLNLRSGPSARYRILASTAPGSRLEILERGDGWTRVRTPDGKEGWIAAGYLAPEPPPTVRLAQLEKEAEALRRSLSQTTEEAQRLRESNASLSSADEGQRGTIERLTRENTKLRAGTRSAEWLTGAAILGLGMVVGAILHGLTGRRRSSRLRL